MADARSPEHDKIRERQCADEVIHDEHVWDRFGKPAFRCPGWPRRRPPARREPCLNPDCRLCREEGRR